MTIFDTIERDVARAEIAYAEVIEEHDNPRNEDDGLLGTMFTEHRRAQLGGEKDSNEVPPFEIDCPRCGGDGEDPERAELQRHDGLGWRVVGVGSVESMSGEQQIMTARHADDLVPPPYRTEAARCLRCGGEGVIETDPKTFFTTTLGARVVLGLDLYEHSGMTIRVTELGSRAFSDPWDSGIVGFICDSKESRERCGVEDWDDERIRNAIKAEIEEYDRYLRGEVFYVTVKVGDEVLDSCHGFIGEAYAREEADSMLTEALETVEERREANTIKGEN